MVENAFKSALKKSGVLEAIPAYNRNDDYYTVIKVSDEATAEKFMELAKGMGIEAKTRRYEEGMDIWVFKAYNKKKEVK